MNTKRLSAILAAALLALTTLAAIRGTGSAAETKTYHFRFGMVVRKETTQGRAADTWAKAVAQKTNGNVRIDVFPNSQLGNEESMLAAVTAGSLDGELVASAILEQQVKQISVIDLPYIFKSTAEQQKLLQGRVGDRLAALMLDKHIKMLAWTTLGTRDVLSKRRVQSLAEMKGLKVRVPNAPVYVGAFKALGADPAPVPINEAYVALQSGVVQAVEIAPEQLYSQKYHEVAKYLISTHHITIAQAIVFNDRAFAQLPKEYQQILLVEAQAVAAKQWTEEDAANEEATRKMQAAGVEVVTIDRAAFAAATRSFNTQFAESVGAKDIYDEIVKSSR